MFGLFKAIKHGLIDGWNGTTKYYHLYGLDPPNNDIQPDESILEEIATIEIIIERQYNIGIALEKELNNTYDLKKRAVILNKLNVLDKQTLKNKQRLNKLKAMV